MKWWHKTLHFLCAIRASMFSIFVSACLILITIILSAHFCVSSLAMTLTISVVASVVATSIVNISAKYVASIHAYRALQHNARQFSIQVKNAQLTADLWQHHFQLCVQGEGVLYKADAERITDAVRGVVDASPNGGPELKQALQELDKALNYDV